MNEQQRAEEHLRVIRTLMERATVYRAISAPTALVGGLLATMASALLMFLKPQEEGGHVSGKLFFLVWISVLFVTVLANSWFVYRAARQRREPAVSPSMKLALRALLPAMLSACVITLPACLSDQGDVLVTLIWMLFYGMALLATAHFSPKSLVRLGWAFLLTALAVYLSLLSLPALGAPSALPDVENFAPLLMGATFGLYHLIYAACAWPRRAGDTVE